MSDQNSKDAPATLAKVNANVVAGAMIAGAAMLAFVGAMLPGWAQFTGPEATWLSIGFYVLAAAEVGIAFYLRAFIRKAQRPANPSVIQR
jgi:hypothetical protein